MNDPVGLDEVPKDIPQPVYIDGILRDSLSNFHSETHTGSSQGLWIGDTYSIESRILERFEVYDSSLIANADSARVTMTVYGGTPMKGLGFAVFPVTSVWDESTVEWNKSSSDSQWNQPGGDYDNTDTIAYVVINDSVVEFTLNQDRFFLLDTSFAVNKGMIFVYVIGDTLLSLYSKESLYHHPKLTLFYGDSTKVYVPVSDAFIVNSTYNQGNNEIVLGEGYAMRALLYFNIDTIPRNVTINRAFLTFGFKQNNSYSDSMTIFIYRVTGDWNEDETEYSSNSLANFTVYKDDTTSLVDITFLVQYWLNEGNNYGILLRPKYESSFCSRLVLDTQQKPTLSVYYTPPPE